MAFGRKVTAGARSVRLDRRPSLASIPSPSSGTITLGPLHLRAYGLMIALGVLAACGWRVGGSKREGSGPGKTCRTSRCGPFPPAIIGSRLYHVITDWRRFEGRWLDAFKIWEGGLGIWGGIAAGVAVGIWAALRRGIPLQGGLSAITPALPLAQAIGRWGNWWNQELFGRPTDLPVGARGLVRQGGGRRLSAGDDLPSHVPLRVAVVPAAVRRADLDRPPVPHLGHGAVRAVRRRLHVHAVLDRAGAHR